MNLLPAIICLRWKIQSEHDIKRLFLSDIFDHTSYVYTDCILDLVSPTLTAILQAVKGTGSHTVHVACER